MPPDSRFTIGDRVVVTDGPLIRYRGQIVARSPATYDNEPVWEVRFPGVLRTSPLRESFLAPAPGAPEHFAGAE